MLRYFVKRSEGEQFEAIATPTGDKLWVVGEQVTNADLGQLAKTYGLDQNILKDVTDVDELPRTEYSEGKEYVFLRSIQRTKRGSVMTCPLLAVLDDNSFYMLSSQQLTLSRETIGQAALHYERQNVGLFLGSFAALVGEYEELVQHTGRIIRDTSKRLRTHDVVNRDFIHFVTVEDNLNQYQMNLDATLGIARRLKDNTHSIFSDDDIEAIDDIILHIGQLLVNVSTSFKSVESIRNAYSTIANNNLNERMKLLTALTVIVALPNVFYGMYGMNVVLPLAEEPWAYWAIVGFTIVLILSVYLLARRLKIF